MTGASRIVAITSINADRAREFPTGPCPYHPAVTLNQLKVFVLVVRLGSFRAAASALGVSEPAVSQALAALRQSLGDQLVRRTGPTLTLTAAGQRVVGLASQMVNLAVAAEDAVRAANGDADLLRVVASANVGDSVAPALLQAFARRASNVEATLGIATSSEMQALLAERLADVALGPALAGPAAPGVVSEPLLRYRLLVVAGHAHPGPPGARAVARRPAPRGVAGRPDRHRPGVGPRPAARRRRRARGERAGVPDPAGGVGVGGDGGGDRPRDRAPVDPRPAPRRRPACRAGDPDRVAVAREHARQAIAAPPSARRLHRFLATPDATQAMYRADGGVPASRFRPPVYVTLWS